jgi:hypothetical protein
MLCQLHLDAEEDPFNKELGAGILFLGEKSD